MTTLVLPESITNSTSDVWAQLTEFCAEARPGDVVQNPKPDARFLCDRPLTVTDNTGIILQQRYPTMAVVRSRFCKTPGVVARNEFTGQGCIEVGPWI